METRRGFIKKSAIIGIQNRTGCRIKSGMTTFDTFTCRSNNTCNL